MTENDLPERVRQLIRELNAGEVGHEEFPEGILRFEGFTDECWDAHERRFGLGGALEGVAIVETEMHSQWLKAHPGMEIAIFSWEGDAQPWGDCFHWAWLVKSDNEERKNA